MTEKSDFLPYNFITLLTLDSWKKEPLEIEYRSVLDKTVAPLVNRYYLSVGQRKGDLRG